MTSIRDIEFMRLFFLSQDISPTVIRKVLKLELLSNYNENIEQYLNSNDNKHMFYHRWKRNEQCCLCPPTGCIKLKRIEHQVFYKLYHVDRKKQSHCPQKENSADRITQFCIHTITAKNGITLDDFDLYMLICLLEPCMSSLFPQTKTHLEVIRKIRNDVCHIKPTDWNENEISNKWSDLKTAVVNLDTSHDTIDAIQKLEMNQFVFNDSEVDRWLTQNENIYRDENDASSDGTCTNLSRLKWFAHFCRTSAREQFQLEIATSCADLEQTATSSVFCRIEVQNSTYSSLHTPTCTIEKGFISKPPQLSLSFQEKCFLLAHNSHLSGTRGVVSWEIENKDFRAAIMWSIPYSYKSGKRNKLSIGFIDQHETNLFVLNQQTTTDEIQIRQAIYDRECNSIQCKRENLEIVGIMTNGYKAVVSIKIKEKRTII